MPPACSRRCWRRLRPEFGDQPQDLGEQPPRHGDLSHRGYVDQVVIGCGGEIIARHPRCYDREDLVFEPVHYLALLERKIGALDHAMAPICWLMSIPWSEAPIAGSLMGTKIVLIELRAYLDLAKLPAETLSDRSPLIMLYALCGFANFASLGIMIAGLAGMCPERRHDIVALGGRSIVSGTLATCVMGAVVGVLT